MEITMSVVVKIMIITSLLIILETRVHCSTQPAKGTPNSYLDRVTHKLKSYKPISFATSHSSVHGDHFSTDNVDPDELERARTNPWNELLGKPLSDVVNEVNKVLPDASVVVNKDGMSPNVLQYHGEELAAVIATDHDDIVHAIFIVKLNK